MEPRAVYRGLFLLGVGAAGVSFAAGFVGAWRSTGRLPGLDQNPLAQAERLERAGDRSAAAREQRASASLNSSSLESTLTAAEQLAWLGDYGSASSLLAKAGERAPGSPRVAASVGWVLLHQRRIDEAEGYLHRALEAAPQDAHAWAGLGEVLSSRGDYEGAIEAFQRSLRLRPHVASVLNGLGIALAGAERLDEAVAAFEAAVASSQVPEFLANLERARAQSAQRRGEGAGP